MFAEKRTDLDIAQHRVLRADHRGRCSTNQAEGWQYPAAENSLHFAFTPKFGGYQSVKAKWHLLFFACRSSDGPRFDEVGLSFFVSHVG